MSNLVPIVVSGDVTIDWLEIPMARSADCGLPEAVGNWRMYAGTKAVARPGGALLLARWIRCATGRDVACPQLTALENIGPERIVHSMAALKRTPYAATGDGSKREVFRIDRYKGFAGPAKGMAAPLGVAGDDARAEIVVLDDAGNGFREVPAVWPVAVTGGQPFVILKASCPLAQGPLWERLQQDHAERLVVVVTADDLRRSGVKLSQRLSWERTAREFVWQMEHHLRLAALARCAWLVVRFGVDGAIVCSCRPGKVEARLFYDPKLGEGGFQDLHPGMMSGVSCALTAAIAAHTAEHGLEEITDGLHRGLQAARRLCQLGFGDNPEAIDYPDGALFTREESREASIIDVRIPRAADSDDPDPDFWCILNDMALAGLESVAVNYMIEGKDPVLDLVPRARFADMTTVDRSEIESYRSIENLIRQYLRMPGVRHPLNIAVFGSPGSGKSFGVAQVAKSVAPGATAKLEFNLSQFNGPGDLVAALHRVRDVVLEGKVPLVFFDEFDSNFNGPLGWLKYFLMPMQDGKFRDGEAVHPIGRAIFVFAGGTCSTFAKFNRTRDASDTDDPKNPTQAVDPQQFRAAKGPDFVSRLRGYVDIKGPNPVGTHDRLYLLRRAIFLRSLLTEKTGRELLRGDAMQIDPAIVRAFLLVPVYKSGTRSMSAILDMCLLAGQRSFEQAALPLSEQLGLHVDAEAFQRLLLQDVAFRAARERLAIEVHARFCKSQEGRRTADDPALQPWEDLAEDLKEANRQQVNHIPEKLTAVGCSFRPARGRPAPFEFSKDEVEELAAMEHERWMRQKLLEHWQPGTVRDHKAKTSPYLVAWSDLTDNVKEWDRNAVRAIPDLLATVNFEIYRVK